MLLIVSLSAALPVATNAAEPGFCRDYAATAVRQVQAALSVPRCRPGMNGPRWAVEYRVHFDWCLGASYDAAHSEQAARASFIYACR